MCALGLVLGQRGIRRNGINLEVQQQLLLLLYDIVYINMGVNAGDNIRRPSKAQYIAHQCAY